MGVVNMWDFLTKLGIALIVLGFIAYLVSLIIKTRQRKDILLISEKIKSLLPESEVFIENLNYFYQIKAVKDEKTFFFKIVYSRENHEFIITNTNKWIVNDNPKQWTRKTQPIFIRGAQEFININEAEKKVVIVYPSSKRIIRYLNESDTVIVKPQDKFLNIHFLKFDDLEKIFKIQ